MKAMRQVVFPPDSLGCTDGALRLPFWLAAEEWVATRLPAGEYLFTWTVEPTVIIGRNQDIDLEVDLDYCREHGIDVCRRRSGGGCVYADRHNIMISFVSDGTDVQRVFAAFAARVAGQLRKMGFDACVSGRNDVLVDGRKISGGAFYRLPTRSIVHSTMLFDTDIDTMTRAITPSRGKLLSKGVTSVEQRIVTAAQVMPGITMADFHAGLLDGLCNGQPYVVTDDDVACIRQLERRYYADEWLYGRRHKGATVRSARIDGVGLVTAHITLGADGRIAAVRFTGDFFDPNGGGAERLADCLTGVATDQASLSAALARVPVPECIANLTADALARLLSGSHEKPDATPRH